MKVHIRYLLLIVILCISNTCYGSIFTIQSLRIGPNPFIQGKQSLLINYLSNKEHSLNYYIYSPTGRLMYQNKVNKPTLEHRYELISQEMMNSFPKQLTLLLRYLHQEMNK